MTDNRTPSYLPLTEREVNGIRDSLRRYGASALDGVDAANLLATLDAARATVSAGPSVDDLSVALQRGGAQSLSHMTFHDIARCVLAALRDGRDDLGAPDEHAKHDYAARPVSAGDDRTLPPDGGERVQCAVCHRWPLASNWPNHMQAKGDHWPIWPPVSLSTGDDRLREALEGMVNQFAYWGGDGITTGGLSALEDAFDVLGYSDPQPAPWRGCDEPGCREEGSSGWPSPTGYRRTCHEHSDFHQQRRCNWPSDSSHFAALPSPATTEDPMPRRCIFEPCVATWEHYHGGFPGGYNDPADPTGVPVPFTGPNPDPSAVRDDHGAALTEDPTP